MSGIERRTSNFRFMLNVESSRPSFRRNAAKPVLDAAADHRLVPLGREPAIWICASYWSDQNQWASSKGSFAPSRFLATCSPIFIALSKCSTRIGPNTGWS